MTFSYTDQQLNYFNRNEGVYSVNSGFVESKGNDWKKITANSKLKKNEINMIQMRNGQKFKVVATESAPSGFDGLAVAPIVNGKPDYNSVAIIAAGTDSDAHFSDVRTAGVEIFTGLSPQYQDAEKFVKRVMDDKRYTVTQLSGYSQGSYMIKVGAKYHIPTTTFNTWFNYSCLTEKEKEYVKNHPKMFTDYRKPKDEIVRLNGRLDLSYEILGLYNICSG